ncbi:MAG: response regulator [Candidatus Solibacter sp.]
MLTAFIVDDNPGDRALIRRILRASVSDPLQIEEAWNLDDALDRLRAGGIDILLLDLNLPGSRGVETVSRVRAVAPQVPIIVVTGFEDQQIASRVVGQGAQGHLVKGTFDSRVLGLEISRCLARKPGESSSDVPPVPDA